MIATENEQTNLDHQHLNLIENVPFQPIFIMGDHRCGTTILYKILGATSCFNIVTAYHIIKYDEILHNHVNRTVERSKAELAAQFIQAGQNDRGIDELQLNPDMPEEYGFLFKTAGFRHQMGPHNVDRVVELGRKIQLTSDPDKPLLLKNPWDYFLNFMYVKETFPNSKFIFIHRNPIQSINSQLKAIRSVLSEQNAYIAMIGDWYRQLFQEPIKLRMARFMFSNHFGLGVKLSTRHVANATEYFLENVSALPESDYVCVRYEDLCAEPQKTVTTILDSLELTGGAAIDYDSFIATRSSPLLNEVEKNQASMRARLNPYFEYFGYS